MKSIASQSNVGFGALKAAGGRAVRPAPSRTGTTVLWLSVVAVLPLSRCCRCRRDGAVAVGDGGAAGVGAVAIGAATVGAAGAVPLSVLSLSVLSLPPPRPAPPRPAPVRQRRQVTGPG